MIVDCYTHTWSSVQQLGRCVPDSRRHTPPTSDFADPARTGAARHFAAAEPVDTTIVLGFKSHYLGAEIPNDEVAALVARHPDRLIGFAGLDPSDPDEATSELARAIEELSMRGVAITPAAQDFHPTDSRAMRVYGEIAARGLPVLFHTGVHVTAATKLDYARPFLLDEVARELPDLKIIVAHMGHPWVEETIVLLAKHPNVFAEISWLLGQPWQAYQALLSAYHHGVTDKLLFGSGFPQDSASHCIEELYGICHLVHGTNLPTIPREQLRGVVERDALTLLGIQRSGPRQAAPPASAPDLEPEDAEV